MPAHLFNFTNCNDLSIVEIGKQKCPPCNTYGPAIRQNYIFHYVISGKGSFHSSTSKKSTDSSVPWKDEPSSPYTEVCAGEGFLIEPGSIHMYSADAEDPWHYMWIEFNGFFASQYLKACNINNKDFIYRPKDYTVHTSQQILTHLNAIFENPGASKTFILGHLHLFFDALASNAKTDTLALTPIHWNTAGNIYLDEAIRYITNYYPEIRSLEEISDFCKISKSHLGRLFREHFHTSLQNFLIQYRLQKAQELLATTNLPIYEIAAKVGYQSELNLLRAFKKQFGISPKDFRKETSI